MKIFVTYMDTHWNSLIEEMSSRTISVGSIQNVPSPHDVVQRPIVSEKDKVGKELDKQKTGRNM